MQPIDFTKAKEEGKGFQFPGEFEITAVGNTSANLPELVPQLLQSVGLQVLHETVRQRESSGGNYVSVTVSFRCDNREQYEAAHQVLRDSPDIRHTL